MTNNKNTIKNNKTTTNGKNNNTKNTQTNNNAKNNKTKKTYQNNTRIRTMVMAMTTRIIVIRRLNRITRRRTRMITIRVTRRRLITRRRTTIIIITRIITRKRIP